MTNWKEVFGKIADSWFFDEPALYHTFCLHEIVENNSMELPFRSGKKRIEYCPEILQEIGPIRTKKFFTHEVMRCALGHPYQRRPKPYKAKIAYKASNLVIEQTKDFLEKHKLEPKQSFEYYYYHLLIEEEKREEEKKEESKEEWETPIEGFKDSLFGFGGGKSGQTKEGSASDSGDDNEQNENNEQSDDKTQDKTQGGSGKGSGQGQSKKQSQEKRDSDSDDVDDVERQGKSKGQNQSQNQGQSQDGSNSDADSSSDSDGNGGEEKGGGKSEGQGEEQCESQDEKQSQDGTDSDSNGDGGEGQGEEQSENQDKSQSQDGAGQGENQSQDGGDTDTNSDTDSDGDGGDGQDESGGQGQRPFQGIPKDDDDYDYIPGNDYENHPCASEGVELWDFDAGAMEEAGENLELYNDIGKPIGNSFHGSYNLNELVKAKKERLPNRVNILRLFRASVVSAMTFTTRMRPSRRFGFALPGKKHGMLPKILVAIDVSGSVPSKMLEKMFGFVWGILKRGVEKIDIITFDEKLRTKKPIRYNPACKVFEIVGCGGTDFQPAIDFFENTKMYDGLIFFTDGFAPTPNLKFKKTKKKIMWLVCLKDKECPLSRFDYLKQFGFLTFYNMEEHK